MLRRIFNGPISEDATGINHHCRQEAGQLINRHIDDIFSSLNKNFNLFLQYNLPQQGAGAGAQPLQSGSGNATPTNWQQAPQLGIPAVYGQCNGRCAHRNYVDAPAVLHPSNDTTRLHRRAPRRPRSPSSSDWESEDDSEDDNTRRRTHVRRARHSLPPTGAPAPTPRVPASPPIEGPLLRPSDGLFANADHGPSNLTRQHPPVRPRSHSGRSPTSEVLPERRPSSGISIHVEPPSQPTSVPFTDGFSIHLASTLAQTTRQRASSGLQPPQSTMSLKPPALVPQRTKAPQVPQATTPESGFWTPENEKHKDLPPVPPQESVLFDFGDRQASISDPNLGPAGRRSLTPAQDKAIERREHERADVNRRPPIRRSASVSSLPSERSWEDRDDSDDYLRKSLHPIIAIIRACQDELKRKLVGGLAEEGMKLQHSLELLENAVNEKGIMVEVEALEKLNVRLRKLFCRLLKPRSYKEFHRLCVGVTPVVEVWIKNISNGESSEEESLGDTNTPACATPVIPSVPLPVDPSTPNMGNHQGSISSRSTNQFRGPSGGTSPRGLGSSHGSHPAKTGKSGGNVAKGNSQNNRAPTDAQPMPMASDSIRSRAKDKGKAREEPSTVNQETKRPS